MTEIEGDNDMRPRRMLMAVAAAVLLVASGCSDGSGGSVEPPSGGWPQPENGQITAKMCGLLTRQDYEQFGHRLLLDLEAQGGQKNVTNGVSCSAPPADELALDCSPPPSRPRSGTRARSPAASFR
jgi:hypothetical protein